MNLKLLPLLLASFASAPALAIHVNISGFVYGSAPSVSFDNDVTGFGFNGEAGAFEGSLSDNVIPPSPLGLSLARARQNSVAPTTSFVAYCAEITQTVFANQDYVYDIANSKSYFTSQKLTDLSRLFTATAGFVDNGSTSAALQAGIWEIIYEPGEAYSLTSGHVTIAPDNSADRAAFAAINNDLAHLSDFAASYNIQVFTNPLRQDFIIASIPEPGTWALLAGGLGALGVVARRRRR